MSIQSLLDYISVIPDGRQQGKLDINYLIFCSSPSVQ